MGAADFETLNKELSQTTTSRYGRVAVLLLLLNSVSALVFIACFNRPVYDDDFNILDVHRYATAGISVKTIRAHRNAPGPTSYIWMAEGVRLLKGNELRDARIAVLSSWVLLASGVLFFSRYSLYPDLWCTALMIALAFPHSVTATATLLTEGPGLAFAILGTLAWIEGVFRQNPRSSWFLMIIGGVFLGISVTCRQYNFAFLAAAGVFSVFEWRRRPRTDRIWRLGIIISLLAAAIPVVLLIIVWGGVSSPGMAAGTSYRGYQAVAGFALIRPIVAAFYVSVYLFPFVLPSIRRLQRPWRLRFLVIASIGGVAIAALRSHLLQPGPLNSFIHIVSRIPAGAPISAALIGSATIFALLAFCISCWTDRSTIFSCPPLLFALLTCLFFIGEQVGVGGNIPFYDRYILQVAPLLGLIAFAIFPQLSRTRVLALTSFCLLGHGMLWRYVLR